MARIYIDTWCVKHEASGMGRYARALIPALVTAAPQHEFVILRPASHRGAVPFAGAAAAVREVFVRRPTADPATLAARPFLEPAFRRFGRADVYHSLFHLLPIGLRRGRFAPRRVVVSLHDLIWLDRNPRTERRWIEAEWLRRFGGIAIPYALRIADHVICGSDATSNRAAGWVPPNRRTTVHYGIDASWRRPSLTSEGSPSYIAAFGVPKAYKNIRCLVRALPFVRQRHPDVHLVLIGGDGGAAAEIQGAGLSGVVSVRTHVDDAEVRALISGSRAFIVPSLVEGFGLPALEAMALGTPLVVSDIDALREVTGDAALRFDPTDAHALADALLRLLEEDALRRDLVARGLARASQFTWSRTADGTLAVYDRVLSLP